MARQKKNMQKKEKSSEATPEASEREVRNLNLKIISLLEKGGDPMEIGALFCELFKVTKDVAYLFNIAYSPYWSKPHISEEGAMMACETLREILANLFGDSKKLSDQGILKDLAIILFMTYFNFARAYPTIKTKILTWLGDEEDPVCKFIDPEQFEKNCDEEPIKPIERVRDIPEEFGEVIERFEQFKSYFHCLYPEAETIFWGKDHSSGQVAIYLCCDEEAVTRRCPPPKRFAVDDELGLPVVLLGKRNGFIRVVDNDKKLEDEGGEEATKRLEVVEEAIEQFKSGWINLTYNEKHVIKDVFPTRDSNGNLVVGFLVQKKGVLESCSPLLPKSVTTAKGVEIPAVILSQWD